MDSFGIPYGAPTIHWEYNISCYDQVIPSDNHIHITVLNKYKYKNGLFTPKYEKTTIISSDMCTKP